MNLCRTHALLRLHAHPHIRLQILVSHRTVSRSRFVVRRAYATHREPVTTSSLLSQELDRKQRTARREDYAGPFQLGIVPPTLQEAGNAKRWSELSAGGKVARTTARTTNLAVILVGAGLSTLLLYALTSEMFSKNSSTVIYGHACDMIKASPKLTQHLQAPLVFHNNPPSAVRPRHRNHHVSSQIVVDAAGREHMLLHFFVQGRPPGAAPAPQSVADSTLDWTRDTAAQLSEMSLDEILDSVRTRGEAALEAAKRVFRFLSGDPAPRRAPPQPAASEAAEEKKEGGWTSGLTGLFSGLRGSAAGTPGAHANSSDGSVHTEGEVHADLVMNDKGYFEFRYLLVDIPGSFRRNSRRIFVERGDGVRETEPVMQWHA